MICDDGVGCCIDRICAEKIVPAGHEPDFVFVGMMNADRGGLISFMPVAMMVSLVGV